MPWLKIVGLAILPVVLLLIVFRTKSAQPQWCIFTARYLSFLLAVPLWIFSLFLLSVQGCEEDRGLIGSPDGRHVARLMIYGNVPAGTSLRVIERKSWSPWWQEVSGAGSIGTPLEPIEPRLTWSDSLHLVIDYPVTTEGTGFDCESKQVGDILIVCRTHKQ